MDILFRIKHLEGAAKVDKQLRPTELIIIGNPKVGTPLKQCAQQLRKSSQRKINSDAAFTGKLNVVLCLGREVIGDPFY